MSPRQPNRRAAKPLLAAAALVAVALLALVPGQCARHGATTRVDTAPAAPTVAAAKRSRPTLSQARAGPPAAGAGEETSPPAGPVGAARMRALTLAFDANGVRVEQSLALPGRVKAPPISYAEHRLEFEVYDAAGRRIYDGSFDDPRHAHADKVGPNGEFIPVEGPTTENRLLLRMPADLAAARIQLFEVEAGVARKPIGTVDLF